MSKILKFPAHYIFNKVSSSDASDSKKLVHEVGKNRQDGTGMSPSDIRALSKNAEMTPEAKRLVANRLVHEAARLLKPLSDRDAAVSELLVDCLRLTIHVDEANCEEIGEDSARVVLY